MIEKIRIASPSEDELLTEIAFSAKRTWNYPEEYYKIWEKELTITKDYIDKNIVFLAERGKQVVGFYSIVLFNGDHIVDNISIESGYWMDHIFVKPNYQKKGIGRRLMQHALNYCKENWIDELRVFVDPHVIDFYEKSGARFIRNSPSSIEGREIPVYGFNLEINL